MIVVSIGRTRHKMATAEHQAAAAKGAQLVELRLDWLARPPDLGRLLNNRPTPVIVTARRTADKGMWKWPEDQRLVALRAAIVAGVEYVDLEEDVARKIPRYGKTKRIVSYHNFEETPYDLDAIWKRLAECDPDIIKIATVANTHADNVRMMRLVSEAKIPTAGFCMGELGLISRVLCCRYGSPLTYCALNAERVLAPGQLTLEQMQNLYRVDSIDAATNVYGVVGDPVGHSLSPLLHNTAFKHAGLNNVYLPLRVPTDTLRLSLQSLQWFGIRGYSVTIPHKEAAFAETQNYDGPIEKIGAVNTLYKDTENRWWAANSDAEAVEDCLMQGLRLLDPSAAAAPMPLAGRRVLILGAGGVARAVAAVAAAGQASLMITNRTSKRGKELAAAFGCQYISWENRGTQFTDILVNCTAVGMHPNVDDTPFAENWLRENMIVFDTVYTPENTLLIKQAKDRNCHVVTGVEMFIRQAARQFQRFTGQEPDLEQLRATLKNATSAVKSDPATQARDQET